MRPIANLTVALLALTGLLSACSEIIPGLNVRASGPGKQEFKVVPSKEDDSGYQVVEQSRTPYQIVPISPEILKSVRTEKSQDFSYSLPAILPSDIPPEYKIGPGDIIYVTVWDHPELTSPYGSGTIDQSVPALEGRPVSADGSVFYPYVGAFKAEGMTTIELRDYLCEHLKATIQDPQVDVRVVAFRAHRIEVTGEVLRPGTVNLDDLPKGILQAIASTGGLTANASRRRLALVRQGHLYQIDLGGLLSGDRLIDNPVVQAGDVIHVPDQSGDQIYVLGAVPQQQQVPMLEASMSLIQALTKAGGLDATRGKQSGVLVFRMHRADTGLRATVYTLDLSRPQGVLLAGEFPLMPRDVVYVQATAFAQYNSVISELLPTVTTIFDLFELKNLVK